MSDTFSLALVGLGGYGNGYVAALLDSPRNDEFRLVGGIDPTPASCVRLNDLKSRGVPLFASLQEFLDAGHRADLIIISSPIQYHADQTCAGLSHGSSVLCEKPLCATVDNAKQMLQCRERAGGKHLVAIGYQWSFSKAIQTLKADIIAGRLGRPRRFKCIALWPRDEAYYTRNGWAGAKQDPQGDWVLDSPVNNACAHQLHNMLYVLGPQTDRSAKPARVTAELYRAHQITNYDTAAMRCFTADGVELLFITTHASTTLRGPVLSYEFENATVSFSEAPGARLIARFRDGTQIDYGSPMESRDRKLWLTIENVREGTPTVCGIEAAAAHTQCVGAAQESTPEIGVFPRDQIRIQGEAGKRKTSVIGLSDILGRCYDLWKLPSELGGVGWAKPGRDVSINGSLD
jgi:predicted dehydrogenase